MDILLNLLEVLWCVIKLTAIALSVPLTLQLLYRYCGAYYVLLREEKKRAKISANEKERTR